MIYFVYRRWMLPRLFPSDLDDKMKSLDLFQHQDDNLIRVTDNQDKFEVSLATQGFKPDELKVNVNGNTLAIEAKHQEKGEGKYVSRHFAR